MKSQFQDGALLHMQRFRQLQILLLQEESPTMYQLLAKPPGSVREQRPGTRGKEEDGSGLVNLPSMGLYSKI